MQTIYKGSNKQTISFINEHVFPYFDKIGAQKYSDSNESNYFVRGEDVISRIKAAFLRDAINHFESYGCPSHAHQAHMVINDHATVIIENGGDILDRARIAIETSHHEMTHVFKIVGSAMVAVAAASVIAGAGVIAMQPIDHKVMERHSDIMAIASEAGMDELFTDINVQQLVARVSSRLEHEGGINYPQHDQIRRIVHEEANILLSNEQNLEKINEQGL